MIPGHKLSKAEAGRLGAQRRWGRRIVRLDSLEPTVRAVVLNLVETSERIAREEAAPVVSETSTETAMEDDGGDRRLPSAS